MRRVYISTDKNWAIIQEDGYEPILLECELEQETETDTKEPEEAPKKAGKAPGVRHCKLCGVAGHRRDNCPDNEFASGKNPDNEEGVEGEDEVAEKIKEMAEAGKKSHEIAKELGISLKVVQKYW